MAKSSVRLPRPLAAYRNVAIAALLCFLVARLYWYGVSAELAPRVSDALTVVELDAATIDWRQLALIPGVGESVAKRLAPVMRRFPDEPARWLEVQGVGPVTLKRVRRCLGPGSERGAGR